MNKQLETWLGEFGKNYTERNSFELEEFDLITENLLGLRQSEIFKKHFEKHLSPAGVKVLEVGCNIGNELALIHEIFPEWELVGLEPQANAIEIGKQRHPFINFVHGSAFEIPFPDNYFDMVMTNGVLIHIHPDDHPKAMSEIVRCSKSLIWLHEYYADNTEEVEYRGREGLLWRTNFADIYKSLHPALVTIESALYDRRDGSGNKDQIALLKK